MTHGAPIDTVLFDMDGTLLDSRDALLRAYRDATWLVLGRRFPVDDADAARVIQLGTREVFVELAGGDRTLAIRVEWAFRALYNDRKAEIGLFPGVEPMLAGLRGEGLRLGVVTSKSRARIDQDLEQTGIRELLDTIVCGDEVLAAKPDPGPVIAAMHALSAQPGHVLFVGDGPQDVVAAHGAGTRAAGAGYGFHREACRAAGPDFWIEAPEELPSLVRTLGVRSSAVRRSARA
jgi:phosphoglycolate phosphatase-like HAD superfamily hydrolase